MTSWIPGADDGDFGIANLPIGIYSDERRGPRPGVAIGDLVVDLDALAARGALDVSGLHGAHVLNDFFDAGRAAWSRTRAALTALFAHDASAPSRELVNANATPRDRVTMHVPAAIGDYVDFYSSIEHATNLGKILRPDGEPLLPNYRWLPVGYHGRSGTVVIDGTPIRRPHGQRKGPNEETPSVGPSRLLDIELEMGWFAGPGNPLGEPIPADEVREHVYGYVLLNDWSARDIQGWEYQPLGPFLGKSFATSISPWVVSLDALEPFRVPHPHQDPPPLDYLRPRESWSYDVGLEVLLETRGMRERGLAPAAVAHSSLRYLYWDVAQQLAHATVNGATIRPGDLFGTGTISGPEPGMYGSFIELTWRGTRPLVLPSGEERTFLQDGDTVVLRGRAQRPGIRVGFGEVRGTIVG